jgi:hypothetical protein
MAEFKSNSHLHEVYISPPIVGIYRVVIIQYPPEYSVFASIQFIGAIVAGIIALIIYIYLRKGIESRKKVLYGTIRQKIEDGIEIEESTLHARYPNIPKDELVDALPKEIGLSSSDFLHLRYLANYEKMAKKFVELNREQYSLKDLEMISKDLDTLAGVHFKHKERKESSTTGGQKTS